MHEVEFCHFSLKQEWTNEISWHEKQAIMVNSLAVFPALYVDALHSNYQLQYLC